MHSDNQPGQVGAELCQAIVDQAPDALIFADRDGRIRLWNKSAERVFDHAEADILGANLNVIIPERFRTAHWKEFNKAIETGTLKAQGQILTTRSMHKNGSTLYVDLSFSLVRDALGAVVGSLAIARDCTERHQAARKDRTPV